MVPSHGPNEEAAAPLRKLRPRVHDHPAGSNGRGPEPKRLLHSFLRGDALADRASGILPAVRDHRPAVVGAATNDIELVPAERTVFVLPQLSGFGMHNQSLRVAMSIAPNFGSRVLRSDEGIVGRNRAVFA